MDDANGQSSDGDGLLRSVYRHLLPPETPDCTIKMQQSRNFRLVFHWGVKASLSVRMPFGNLYCLRSCHAVYKEGYFICYPCYSVTTKQEA